MELKITKKGDGVVVVKIWRKEMTRTETESADVTVGDEKEYMTLEAANALHYLLD